MDHYSSLKDKVALVTGAGSGMGKASAIQLAKQGVKVCLVDLKKDHGKETKEEIESNGGEAIIIEADVSNPQELEHAFEKVIERFSKLDIVFANAGINGTMAPIEDLKPEEWDETLSTNLKSTFLTVKYAIPHLKHDGGSIVLTSSINGSRVFSNFGMSAYSSSKAAQVAFSKMAALELANYRIRVNVICPGAIETNIGENTHPKKEQLQKIEIPVKYPEGNQPLEHQPGTPEQVADLVSFLASDASSHITGTELFIDGAESLL
ncbi:3-oxoacyl-[acyl-carrier-protein] reductase [Salipaludibacillus keqinensis]|uniref:3-oxoacyl-[acyl-carrier-protein] reductase n=2 Tax=Salipaludibacillus keqinensis TaxID=2045207 RepID=A0A323TBH7_9BACI|nr:3-oxoacyl-[acyl-carrier-protein] reductase [Salipaludibacillus keqinensis]